VNTAAGQATGPRARARGWGVLASRATLLAYLTFIVTAVGNDSRGAGAVAGYVIVAAFGVGWLFVPLPVMLGIPQLPVYRFWIIYGVLTGLFLAELPFAHAQAFVMAVFLTILTVARAGTRSVPVVLALAVAALVVPVAVPSWHVSLGAAWDDVTPIAIPVVALMTFAIHQSLTSTHALAEARAELASLAAERERFRIARDLHDLLGHSLTTITVKAGLAARIGQADHARATREMAEVEALARQALAEVRAAVTSYREVTLAGELATGRELLRAAGITADLPRAVDDIDPAHQELFGWVVREGLTNIVRHSRARSCAVRLSPSSIEITDDGIGSSAPPGNGLTGLRERVAAAGGSIEAGPAHPAGWRLRVRLSAEAAT
jgi:two-component system, NarL family, sensor histidine kinase DesK